MADGTITLQRWIAKIRELGTVPEDAAPEVAKELEAEIQANIAAGRGPDGEPWKLTAAGDRPLKRAGAQVRVRVMGSTILVTLTGPEVRHHRGTARGRITRRVIPTGQLNGPALAAVKRVILRRCAQVSHG
jgi:hypothetical protein